VCDVTSCFRTPQIFTAPTSRPNERLLAESKLKNEFSACFRRAPNTGAFQGVIFAPNDKTSATNATLNGRFFGGAGEDMQIVSGTTITAPPPRQVPDAGSTVLLMGVGLAFLAAVKRKFHS